MLFNDFFSNAIARIASDIGMCFHRSSNSTE